MRCGSDQLSGDPVSHASGVDCDVKRVGRDSDAALRRASSLPDDPVSASQASPTSPTLSPSRQSKAGSRSSADGGIVAERMKRFSEKAAGASRSSSTPTGCTSPTTSSSSRCSRNDSTESPSHSGQCYIDIVCKYCVMQYTGSEVVWKYYCIIVFVFGYI